MHLRQDHTIQHAAKEDLWRIRDVGQFTYLKPRGQVPRCRGRENWHQAVCADCDRFDKGLADGVVFSRQAVDQGNVDLARQQKRKAFVKIGRPQPDMGRLKAGVDALDDQGRQRGGQRVLAGNCDAVCGHPFPATKIGDQLAQVIGQFRDLVPLIRRGGQQLHRFAAAVEKFDPDLFFNMLDPS